MQPIEPRQDTKASSNGAARIATALAFTVPEFCEAHGISRALYYILAREGRAPASMKVGRRRLIARESAEAWRRQMERAGA
jgi:predicted DNA-binding transcriptional regulator AlpA